MSLPRAWPVGSYRVSFRSPDDEDGKEGKELGSANFLIAAPVDE